MFLRLMMINGAVNTCSERTEWLCIIGVVATCFRMIRHQFQVGVMVCSQMFVIRWSVELRQWRGLVSLTALSRDQLHDLTPINFRFHSV